MNILRFRIRVQSSNLVLGRQENKAEVKAVYTNLPPMVL